MYHPDRDLLVNGVMIYSQIDDSIKAYDAGQFESFGEFIGSALAHVAHPDATSMNAWADPLPDIVNGWDTSVGTEKQRDAAAQHFGVSVQTGESVWRKNVMTPFVGKSMLMTGIKIEKRNAFNTLIEHEVKTGKVIWTLKEGTDSVSGPWDEHINGKFTGTSRIAGWVSENGWIESDFKSLFKLKIENDWGYCVATSATDKVVVMEYSSYQKGTFQMTWTLIDEADDNENLLQV